MIGHEWEADLLRLGPLNFRRGSQPTSRSFPASQRAKGYLHSALGSKVEKGILKRVLPIPRRLCAECITQDYQQSGFPVVSAL